MMFTWLTQCRHKKLSEVKDDGRQYCLYCNKAFIPDCAHSWVLFGKDKQKCERCGELRYLVEGPCVHKWVIYGQTKITNTITGIQLDVIYTLQCSKCGEMKDFRTGVSTPSQK